MVFIYLIVTVSLSQDGGVVSPSERVLEHVFVEITQWSDRSPKETDQLHVR
jgi:hypothetical protein